MNLFWETRQLTQAREDHLTCFLAAALEADDAFRQAYERRVLPSLSIGESVPQIAALETQAQFRSESCRPDLLLRLSDGRTVICEHKLEAAETPHIALDGGVTLQLERYLALPVDAVTYFRPALVGLGDDILSHPKYACPTSAAHFLWRDLYEALGLGKHAITVWLRDGFERLGFTPPVPHIGELWPDDSEAVRQNQENFAKLWHSTRSHAGKHWKVNTGRRCELYLLPRTPQFISQVYISPLAQAGTLLRIRAQSTETHLAEVRQRIEAVLKGLPVPAELVVSSRLSYCDVLAPLHLILSADADVVAQEARLFGQVAPVIDALTAES